MARGNGRRGTCVSRCAWQCHQRQGIRWSPRRAGNRYQQAGSNNVQTDALRPEQSRGNWNGLLRQQQLCEYRSDQGWELSNPWKVRCAADCAEPLKPRQQPASRLWVSGNRSKHKPLRKRGVPSVWADASETKPSRPQRLTRRVLPWAVRRCLPLRRLDTWLPFIRPRHDNDRLHVEPFWKHMDRGQCRYSGGETTMILRYLCLAMCLL